MEKCRKCDMPLEDVSKCGCDPSLCEHCCECDAECECNCQ